MLKRFTPHARQVVLVALEEARGLRHPEITVEHLLLGALRCGGAAAHALAQLGLREGAVRARIGIRLPRGEADEDADVSLGAAAVWALGAAVRIAEAADEPQIGSGQILRALAEAPAACEILAACGVSPDAVRAAVRRQAPDGDEVFAAAVTAIDAGDPTAAARALTAIVLRRGAVAAWLAERGVDEAAVRRAFPAVEPAEPAAERPARSA